MRTKNFKCKSNNLKNRFKKDKINEKKMYSQFYEFYVES